MDSSSSRELLALLSYANLFVSLLAFCARLCVDPCAHRASKTEDRARLNCLLAAHIFVLFPVCVVSLAGCAAAAVWAFVDPLGPPAGTEYLFTLAAMLLALVVAADAMVMVPMAAGYYLRRRMTGEHPLEALRSRRRRRERRRARNQPPPSYSDLFGAGVQCSDSRGQSGSVYIINVDDLSEEQMPPSYDEAVVDHSEQATVRVAY